MFSTGISLTFEGKRRGVLMLPPPPHPLPCHFISFALISPSTLASCTPWLAHTHEKHVTPEFGHRVYPSGLLYIIYSDLEHFRRAFFPFPIVGAICQGFSAHVVTTLKLARAYTFPRHLYQSYC